MNSGVNKLKSKLRAAPCTTWSSLALVTACPFSVTWLNSDGNPRTLTNLPSFESRVIWTPGTRCNASATFLSGNFPTSSAVMTSATTSRSRLSCRDLLTLPRIPVTTTSSIPCSAANSTCPTARVLTMPSDASVLIRQSLVRVDSSAPDSARTPPKAAIFVTSFGYMAASRSIRLVVSDHSSIECSKSSAFWAIPRGRSHP